MTLEEYTNSNKDDAFIYWIESRLDKLGSIWGGSAFKFGIYCRDKTAAKDAASGRIWSEKYSWLSKFGATEQKAFATVRSRLAEVVDAARQGNFARVEEVDLAPMLKWKVAFLYQDRKAPTLFPVFKKETLFLEYKAIDPRARLGSTPYHVMYETLMERNRELGDVFEIARSVWERYTTEKNRAPRAWAVPLSWTIQESAAIDVLCQQTRVEAEDVDSFLNNLLTGADLSEGDQLAFLVEGDVRALGTLTHAEPGQFAWDQVPVNFPSGLLVNPTSEVRELTAAEREEVWSHLPPQELPEEGLVTGPRYWKIAPGKNAVAWPDWKERGIAAIGWPELGDLTKATKADFEKRAAKCAKEHEYSKGMSQVWTFRNIRPGDRVVANQGKHTVLGIGTVVSGYQYQPGSHTVEGEDYPHQIKVTWDDTTPRSVEQYGWQRTIVELSKSDFDALLARAPSSEAKLKEPEPPAPPCEPRNIILYGPPGTGKTYSTVRRALELMLGPDKLAGLRDKGLLALFREHQARGQVEFVTFHQAYGYEEFVEGIRPVLDQAANAQVNYEIHDGVFKRIALRAAAEGLRTDSGVREFDELWDVFLRDLAESKGRALQDHAGKAYRLATNAGGDLVVAPAVGSTTNKERPDTEGATVSKEQVQAYWRGHGKPDPDGAIKKQLQLSPGEVGVRQYNALGLIHSELLSLSLSRLESTRRVDPRYRLSRVQQALDKPGPTTTFSFSALTPQYVLIIDEINRGNMSKILGELITLLEPDKRLASRNELKLPLSYSPQHRFAVPPNLHVLGTMNTADRSIALMDVALRRRFTFEELMPDAGVIRSMLQARVPDKPFIDLAVGVFEALNDRIRFLYDRDHQLGHSYFLEVTDAASLQQVFLDRILPMLQEYFYGAWDKICVVLGCPYNEVGEPKRRDPHLLDSKSSGKTYAHPIVTARTFPEAKMLGFDHDDYESRIDYHVRSAFAQGSLSKEDLYRTFLGILAVDAATFDQRLAELTAQPALVSEAVS
jgi:5-methylcytosine-specific restriction endonuclease McrBC GTP-binding regulatory subunit McrB